MDGKKPVASSRLDNATDLHHQRLAAAALDLKQAAAFLGCHPKTVRLMAQAGKIPARRVGKLWRFSALRLKEWLEAS